MKRTLRSQTAQMENEECQKKKKNRFGYHQPIPVNETSENNENQMEDKKPFLRRKPMTMSTSSTYGINSKKLSNNSSKMQVNCASLSRTVKVKPKLFKTQLRPPLVPSSSSNMPTTINASQPSPNQEDIDEKDLLNHPESIGDLLQIYINNTDLLNDMETLLKHKSKVNKFNLKAKQEEQIQYIRKLRSTMKQIVEERKLFKEAANILDEKLRSKANLSFQEIQMLKKKNIDMISRQQLLEAKVSKIEHESQKSDELKNRLLNDQKDIINQRQDELEARVVLEHEKVSLTKELNELQMKFELCHRECEELKQSEQLFQQQTEEKYRLLSEKNVQKQQELAAQFEDKVKEMECQCNLLQRQLEDKESEKQILKDQFKTVQSRYSTEEKEKEFFANQLKATQSQLEDRNDQIIRNEQEIQILKEKLDKKDLEVSNAFTSLKEIQSFAMSTNVNLKNDKQQLEDKLVQFEKKCTTLEELKSSNLLIIQQLQGRVKNLEEQQRKSESDAAEKIEKYDRNMLEMQKQNEELIVQTELKLLLESQLNQLRSEFIATNAQMEAIKAENEIAKHSSILSKKKNDEAIFNLHQKHSEKMLLLKEKFDESQERVICLESEIRILRENKEALALEKRVTENSVVDNNEKIKGELCEATIEVDRLKLKLKEVTLHNEQAAALQATSIAEFERKIQEGEAMRRKMHNIIQELRGNVRVFARTRPFLPSDKVDRHMQESSIKCDQDGQGLQISCTMTSKNKNELQQHSFKFDKVFAPSAGQDCVFKEVSEFVQSALDGYSVCLFSYGQTGSGKTHTMQGSGMHHMRGIIPRSIEKVIAQIDVLAEQGWKYDMKVSFLEIYNESVRDLLEPTSTNLSIKRNSLGKTYVQNLKHLCVSDLGAIESIMTQASRQRSVCATDMNATSSRSHSVFTLHLTGSNEAQGKILEGTLNLVDLAGSERLSRSGATGDRQKETAAINKSLSSLADVFAALGNKNSHVPFRNSKLTFLLQNCLSGDGKTLMMVNLSPTAESYQESLCSLRFAKQVNQCELGKPKRQVHSKSKS